MGGSDGMAEYVVCGEAIAMDVGRVKVDEFDEAGDKRRESNSLLRCKYAVVEDGYEVGESDVMMK